MLGEEIHAWSLLRMNGSTVSSSGYQLPHREQVVGGEGWNHYHKMIELTIRSRVSKVKVTKYKCSNCLKQCLFPFCFRHACQLSSYVACQRYDQDSKRKFPCHRHCNHAVPFSHRSVVGFKSTVHNQSIPGLLALSVELNTLKRVQRDRQVQSKCFTGGHHLLAWIKPCTNQANLSPVKTTMFCGNVLNLKHTGLLCGHQRQTFHTSSISYDPSPSKAGITKLLEDEEKKSKVEEAVEAMKEKKEKLKEKAFQMECSPEEIEPIVAVSPAPKKSLWQRVKQEAVHYYHGFKLLYFEVRIAARRLWQVMNGKVLSRRERRQVTRV